jgi:hypothetical protein
MARRETFWEKERLKNEALLDRWCNCFGSCCRSIRWIT